MIERLSTFENVFFHIGLYNLASLSVLRCYVDILEGLTKCSVSIRASSCVNSMKNPKVTLRKLGRSKCSGMPSSLLWNAVIRASGMSTFTGDPGDLMKRRQYNAVYSPFILKLWKTIRTSCIFSMTS